MLRYPPPKPRREGKQPRKASVTSSPPPPPPPTPLTLVSAAYDGARAVTLTFDQAIDISALVPSSVKVNNSDAELLYIGTDASLTSAAVLLVTMNDDEASSDDGVWLEAPADRIVAADGGSSWEGADELELPYP